MRILISSPDFDNTTRYLHAWAKKLASEVTKSHDVFHVEGKKANKKRICGILQKRNIDVVVLNGHGADDRIAGHENEILIDTKNATLLSGKSVHALSCSTAKKLGKAAIQAGAKSYVGYDEKFVFITSASKTSKPLQDERAALFLNPAFTAPKALIDGKSPDEAVLLTKKAFARSIQQALNSNVQSDNDKCVDWLWWDFKHLQAST